MSNSPTLIQYADNYFEQKNYNKALEIYSNIATQEPNYPLIYLAIARTYVELNEIQLAFDYFKLQHLANLEDKNDLDEQEFSNREIKTFYYLGLAYLKFQQLDKASELFQTLKAISPNDSIFSVALGDVNLLQQNVEDAARHYQEAIRLNPTNTKAYYGMASIHKALNDIPNALQKLELVLKHSHFTEYDYFLASSRKLSLLLEPVAFSSTLKKMVQDALIIKKTSEHYSLLAQDYLQESRIYYSMYLSSLEQDPELDYLFIRLLAIHGCIDEANALLQHLHEQYTQDQIQTIKKEIFECEKLAKSKQIQNIIACAKEQLAFNNDDEASKLVAEGLKLDHSNSQLLVLDMQIRHKDNAQMTGLLGELEISIQKYERLLPFLRANRSSEISKPQATTIAQTVPTTSVSQERYSPNDNNCTYNPSA